VMARRSFWGYPVSKPSKGRFSRVLQLVWSPLKPSFRSLYKIDLLPDRSPRDVRILQPG
jgi:hypothetical protein